MRPDDHDHVPAILLRCGLDEAQLFYVSGQALQQLEPELGPGLLTAPEHDRYLDLVALLQEALDMALLGPVVMWVNLRSELDLLDDCLGLVLARFPGLQC